MSRYRVTIAVDTYDRSPETTAEDVRRAAEAGADALALALGTGAAWVELDTIESLGT